jgi:hypothetical protein
MTDQPQHKLTPTERLHDLAMAAITKQASTARGAETVELKQAATGPHAGQWYCSTLGIVCQEGETIMEAWSRALDAARQIQADTTNLNAAALSDALSATLEAKAKGAKS